MKKTLIAFLFLFLFTSQAFAQSPTSSYVKAKVESVIEEGTKNISGKQNIYQKISVSILDGADKGKKLTLDYGGGTLITAQQKLHPGETVVITKLSQDKKTVYVVSDRYRLPGIALFTIIFVACVLVLTGKKGLGSLAGLAISLFIIVGFIVPQILSGSDPLFTSILGSLIIMITTLYLAHGFNSKTTIALVSTFISLVLTGILAIISVHISKLYGLGSEDAYNLLLGSPTTINLQGLLLGGIIIGALGVLDDTTTTQSTTVAELAEANPNYTMSMLFQKGMIIGKEHIASLVNTLVLAYAGAGIGIFIVIILSLQNHSQPLWMIFNSELLSEEIVRTLVGSLGLVLAVPITTLLASFFAKHEIKIS
ncbi:MAG: YibE/F family protein [Candidatus Levybacteria bacterium]|nr:YibE/F family protein [Candidatus Levybacteria bacterium]